ncbi:hypothetical protein GK047_19655 [Paenibacillus sp. SYP-B3998]|uniref:Uncharacterized protein n=1 Tax=Paenibacillus sp. SYP-B3998 TaxID=2678564 RepID=A0A6G4A1L3_9BACL|nr:hypothetical protein [Paenibacillus sp. SYP-B3998]NEW08220.1 hypothetical protein [Paenibacillus sp. SYP-B3998]
MQYGSREICNVVLKDIKTKEPVVYLESLTTADIDVKGTTVWAKGGRGAPKRIGWDSEKDITQKMESALITKEAFGVLAGSKFSATTKPVHKKEVLTVVDDATDKSVTLSAKPTATAGYLTFFYKTDDGSSIGEKLTATVTTTGTGAAAVTKAKFTGAPVLATGDIVIVDYYVDAPAKSQTISIDADKFPGTYMLEGETIWRNEAGHDVPALYTIPKLKISPNFVISMAMNGEPKPFHFEAAILKDSKSQSMILIDLLEE